MTNFLSIFRIASSHLRKYNPKLKNDIGIFIIADENYERSRIYCYFLTFKEKSEAYVIGD